MNLILVAAVSDNGVIGRDGKMPWHISEDLKRFKTSTMRHPVIMGRRTFESIYQSLGKPLFGRLNMVLSRKDLGYGGIHVARSMEEAIEGLEKGQPFHEGIDYGSAYIIGGGMVYREAVDLVSQMEITHVHRVVEGDTFLDINWKDWRPVDVDDRGDYSFVGYVRR